MIEITNDDIIKVEQKFNLTFDDESIDFIKCMESKDIKACPGAGKTTSLVAKLDILANNMPFNDNSGVLVLTHTNVAVDEIKNKLGANARIILGYPNHVGTFQSFVNKFLAIPMYIKLTGEKPERIDNNIFENLFYTKLDYNTRFGLKEKFKQKSTNKQEQEKNVKSFLKSFYISKDNILLRFDGKLFEYKSNPPSKTYKTLRDIKNELFKEGFLIFDDTYHLALQYITEYPNISNIFQKRFKYAFIDEAQDTNDKQFEIIEKLFKNSDTVIQRIGDNNQAIFNFSGESSKGWQLKEDNNIEINNTKRLSKLIAKQASKVAVMPQELKGIESINIKPIIILFDDDNIKNVIKKYAELIVKHNLHSISNATFKAIGGVGKTHDTQHTISNYHSDYQKDDNNSLLYDNLIEKLKEFDKNTITPKKYRSMILDIIKSYLKQENIKYNDNYHTKYSILKYLKEENETTFNDFKLQIFKMTEKLYLNDCIKDGLKSAIQTILDLHNKTIDTSILNNIIENYKIDFKKTSSNNIYTYAKGDINFDIEIQTIHKSKGETHTATLIIETYKDGYDIFQLLSYFQGNNKKVPKTIINKKKLIYVATSRATHFLCLALHQRHTHRKKDNEVTDDDIKDLEDNGFKIIKLN